MNFTWYGEGVPPTRDRGVGHPLSVSALPSASFNSISKGPRCRSFIHDHQGYRGGRGLSSGWSTVTAGSFGGGLRKSRKMGNKFRFSFFPFLSEDLGIESSVCVTVTGGR
ncbi:hypothetical protein CEXT_264111 [Caerostris extrusa]|uniref:Uncharacterized protein n=1 Tax=Caerostris extrusa TaxID=172846 RepID=A0AAV4P946_CAEEX|nr:hypothetical protein CEXT_264111 [Caerostris extrusa]